MKKQPDRRWIAYESLAPAGERTVTETNAEGTVTAYVLKEARLLGLVSKNERTYLMPAATLYEGAKVNIDHPDWMQGTKSQNDKMGFVRNAKAVEGKGIFGDIVMNPEHPRAKQHLWDAENDPNNQGFSHVAINERADVSEASDGGPVYTVVEVISVDLVGRPATTNGMFEGESTVNEQELRDEVARLKTALTEAESKIGVAEQALSEEEKAHQETKREHAESLVTAEREALLEGIDGEIVDSFRKAVLSAESVEAAKELIAAIRPTGNKATSKEQTEASKDESDKQKTYEELEKSGALNYREAK